MGKWARAGLHGRTENADPLVPRLARIVHTNRGHEVRSPKRNRLLGVFNNSGQLEIKYRDELVIVEVHSA